MNSSQRAAVVCLKARLSIGGKACIEIQQALEQQELDARQACADAVAKVAGESGDDLIDAGSAMSTPGLSSAVARSNVAPSASSLSCCQQKAQGGSVI